MTTEALQAAQAGSGDAFRELTEPYLAELHRHCYRMLGSLDGADDLMQETLLAAWRGLAGFGGSASLRTWLYRIATNRCLNAIRDRARRPPAAPVPPFDPPAPSRSYEVRWLQPFPDRLLDPAQRYESRTQIELAFIVALQLLPPRQTAAVLLVDVLGFETAEVADLLGTGRTTVKGLLQRGRAGLAAARESQDGSRPGSRSERESELAARFAAAFAADDVDGVVALLADDAWLAMPPAAHQYLGAEAVATFLRASARGRGTLTLLPTGANRQPAFGCYVTGPDQPSAVGTGIVVITLGAGAERITGITRFLDPGLHDRFGLPRAM